MPAPIACPVKPFVLAITTCDASSPNVWRSDSISVCALPPRAGEYVSWETKTVLLAISARFTP